MTETDDICIIRPARLQDVPQLVAMGVLFHSAARVAIPFDADHLAKNLRRMLRSNTTRIVVLVQNKTDRIVGAAGVHVSKSFFSSTPVAQELFYWIMPEVRGRYGRDFLLRLEDEAWDLDATFMTMIALENSDPERVGQIYRNAGFVPLERVYIKKIN